MSASVYLWLLAMLFQFNAHSALLLPFVVPGAALTLFLLLRAARTGSRPDLLLALLIAWPMLAVSQWLLGYANWYDSHDWHSTVMFYVPWQLHLLLGPLWFLYFKSLTNREFRLRDGAWRHLLPGLLEIGLFAGVALLDLGWRRGLRGEVLPDFFGTKGAAATWRDGLFPFFAYAGYALLLGYGLATLRAYRRYRRYLDDNFSQTERLRFAGLRQVLILLLAGLVLGVVWSGLEIFFDGFSYDTEWYAFAVRGALIYALAVVGLQANYAAATSPLRFEPTGQVPLATPPAALAREARRADTALIFGPAPPAGAPPAQPAGGMAAPGAAAAGAAASLEAGAATLAEPAGDKPTPATDPAGGTHAPVGLTLAPELLAGRARLLAFMAEERPYLEPELTLAELAQRLRLNTSVLSKVINAGCGQNFNDFVNTYRVAEARRQLADPRRAHYSLVGVALESGFNSKSTFNRVFKKLSGQAPSTVARPDK